jgi:hypothetical protein
MPQRPSHPPSSAQQPQRARPAQPAPQSPQQVDPPQQDYVQQSAYSPPPRRAVRPPKASMGPVVGLVIVSLILLVLMIYQTVTKNTLQDVHSDTVQKYNDLKEQYAALSEEFKTPVAALGSGTDATTPADRDAYVRQLERELLATEKTAAMYLQSMTPQQRQALRRREDIHVRDASVEDTGSNLVVKFNVVNGSDMPARDVEGAMRFWYNNRIVHSQPFRLAELPAKSQQPMKLTMPVFEWTDFQGFVTARPK